MRGNAYPDPVNDWEARQAIQREFETDVEPWPQFTEEEINAMFAGERAVDIEANEDPPHFHECGHHCARLDCGWPRDHYCTACQFRLGRI